MHHHRLPEIGLLRLADILGDLKKGKPAIIPVSRSTWFAGLKAGRFPKGILIGPNTRAWTDTVRKERNLLLQALVLLTRFGSAIYRDHRAPASISATRSLI